MVIITSISWSLGLFRPKTNGVINLLIITGRSKKKRKRFARTNTLPVQIVEAEMREMLDDLAGSPMT